MVIIFWGAASKRDQKKTANRGKWFAVQNVSIHNSGANGIITIK
jgi:hypothetical protein